MQNDENQKKLERPYNIGLDIGTTSVGWAVIDENYKIIKKGNNQKALWGVYLFDEAVKAEDRRKFRSTRRRYDRRRERIRLLQEIFKDEINKVDPNFFQKLKESFYHEDDKENKTIVLTKEEKEAMKAYQNKYPTIYHLRNKLLASSEKEDIRLVYLAIHHIIKYRGNFNYNIKDFDINKLDIKDDLKNVLEEIFATCQDIYSILEPTIDSIDLCELENILLNDNKREKKKLLENNLQTIFQKKVSTELANALVGYTVNLENLFAVELEENKKIDFSAGDFEENLEKLDAELDSKIGVLKGLKELLNVIQLKLIFKGDNEASISKLMVKYYNIHDKDLEDLKNIIRTNPKYFKTFFKDKVSDKNKEELCIYTRYVRNQMTYADFGNEIKKILENVKTDENEEKINDILERIDKGDFMPRITDTSNGKYPYQINEAEIKKIIENQGIYYPFLKEMVNGEYKLVTLLKFKIPYYVGPLVQSYQSKNAWLVRKSDEKITPFNFNEIVDKRKTAKEFIMRMVGHCSYLLKEYAMPNNSIFYSKFKVLNELKQIKINDRSISDNLPFIEKIYNEFFLKTEGSLTNKKFEKYLRTKDELSMYIDDMTAELKITGYSSDEKFANTMASYIDFFSEDGFFKDTNLTEEDADKIIELITIFEDKDILEEEILELYPCLQPKVKKICAKRYKGWSSLSRKLLETKYYLDDETQTKKSIMDLMYETKENFMQILNNPKYKFWDMINQENNIDTENELDYSLVAELATSPANKRGIWESLKIIKEITDYMGYEPANIAIEMARGDGKKGRVPDRKKMLLNLYDKFKSEIDDYNRLRNQIRSKDKIDTEKLLLYFLQEGKSLYSGTPLDINNLSSYEVDHILPQTLIKDDSIDNKALVLKNENQDKRDNLVLPAGYRTQKQQVWWRHLKKIGLISQKKYNNLRRDEFRDKDIEGFINRQLVETRQITKHVANIVKNLYQDTNVIYVKANISHNYREKFELFKYRELNDYHHAHDAYLAIVLGIYQNKYLKTKINKYELKDTIHKLIEEKKYDELKYGYVVNSIDQDFVKINDQTGEVALVIKDITDAIEKALYRNDIEVVKKTEIKSGEFYNQTKNKKGMKGVPLKKGLKTELYGSYTSLNPSYTVVVNYMKKGKVEQRMIGIPIYIDVQKDDDAKLNYIAELLELDNVDSIKIVKDKIPFYSILNWNGQICSLVGATAKVEVCNALEFKLEKDCQIKWKYTLNRLINGKKKSIADISYQNELQEFLLYIVYKMENEYKLYENLIPELKGYINQETVSKMNIETLEKATLELLKLLKFNSATANLQFLNSKASIAFGKKNGRIINHAIIIQKSPTGLKVRKYEF